MVNISNKYLKILNGLGLNKNQTVLYITSLKYGILSVVELAKRTGINRQQIYEEAEKLLQMGLYDITRKDRRKYIPAPPTRLLRLGHERITETEEMLSSLTTLLPSLEAMAQPKKKKVVVKYYEGMDRIKEAYQKELEQCQGTEVLSFAGSVDDLYQFFPESYWDKWNEQFVKQESRSRMLVHKSPVAEETAKLDSEYNRDTRYLEDFPLKVNIDVFNNSILTVSFYDELAIWVDSAVLAESYRVMFNTFWKLSKSFK